MTVSQCAAHGTDQCESLVRRKNQTAITAIYDPIDECNLGFYIILACRSIPVNRRPGAAGCNLSAHMCGLPVHRAVSLRNKGDSGRRLRFTAGSAKRNYQRKAELCRNSPLACADISALANFCHLRAARSLRPKTKQGQD